MNINASLTEVQHDVLVTYLKSGHSLTKEKRDEITSPLLDALAKAKADAELRARDRPRITCDVALEAVVMVLSDLVGHVTTQTVVTEEVAHLLEVDKADVTAPVSNALGRLAHSGEIVRGSRIGRSISIHIRKLLSDKEREAAIRAAQAAEKLRADAS